MKFVFLSIICILLCCNVTSAGLYEEVHEQVRQQIAQQRQATEQRELEINQKYNYLIAERKSKAADMYLKESQPIYDEHITFDTHIRLLAISMILLSIVLCAVFLRKYGFKKIATIFVISCSLIGLTYYFACNIQDKSFNEKNEKIKAKEQQMADCTDLENAMKQELDELHGRTPWQRAERQERAQAMQAEEMQNSMKKLNEKVDQIRSQQQFQHR